MNNLADLEEIFKNNSIYKSYDENVHLEFGRHFEISCLATLVLLFYDKKSTKVKKSWT
jgi:hypothetical protein